MTYKLTLRLTNIKDAPPNSISETRLALNWTRWKRLEENHYEFIYNEDPKTLEKWIKQLIFPGVIAEVTITPFDPQRTFVVRG